MNQISHWRNCAFEVQIRIVTISAIVCPLFGCGPDQSGTSIHPPTREAESVAATATPPVTVTNLQQAFNLGIAKVNSDGFSVDKWKCKMMIQKCEKGWLMTVTSVPPTIGGEQIDLIETNGDVLAGFGY